MKVFRLNYLKTFLWPLCFSLAVVCGHAWADLAAQVRLSQEKLRMHCPAMDQLKLNTQSKIWTSPGGWKAYEKSFGTKIKRFVGAQWIGVKLGQIICIYQPVGSFTFPVFVYYNKQVIQPSTNAWVKVEKNRFNCALNDLKMCIFSPLQSQKQIDPDDIASQIKPGDAPQLPDSNL